MFTLPELKNPYSAYGPYIDAQTMETHHSKHHAGYVKKLNQACIDNNIEPQRVEDLFNDITSLPSAIRNNAGGHYNHTLFWELLSPVMTTPSSELLAKINDDFGGLDAFKNMFNQAALGVFGSGWVWLVVDENNDLKITTTQNQDNPLMSDINTGYPLLGIDVWEHAYYLNYQNRRNEYLENIWALINWEVISGRYAHCLEMNDLA